MELHRVAMVLFAVLLAFSVAVALARVACGERDVVAAKQVAPLTVPAGDVHRSGGPWLRVGERSREHSSAAPAHAGVGD